MKLPDWLFAWGEMQSEAARQRSLRSWYRGLDHARTLSTERLKELWDCYDGGDFSIPDEALSGETIHFVLNERGEGAYCAV